MEEAGLAARNSFEKQSILWENFQRSSSRKHCFSSRIASPSFLISDESLFVKTHPFPFWLIQFDHFLIFKIEWSAREQTTFLFFFPYIFSQLYASTFHSFTLHYGIRADIRKCSTLKIDFSANFCSSQPSMVQWLSSSIFPFCRRPSVPLWWHPTKSPLLLPLDPQTHTFSESLW